VTLTIGLWRADQFGMGRSVIGMCATFGMVLGGFIPEMWGAGSFSVQSLLFSGLGGVAGIWAGVRIADL
jgi:hypothetical protein